MSPLLLLMLAVGQPAAPIYHWPRYSLYQPAQIVIRTSPSLDPGFLPILRSVTDEYEQTGDIHFVYKGSKPCTSWPRGICVSERSWGANDPVGSNITVKEGGKIGWHFAYSQVYVNASRVSPNQSFSLAGTSTGSQSVARMTLCHEIGEAIGLRDVWDDGAPDYFYQPTCLTQDWEQLTDQPSTDDIAELHTIYTHHLNRNELRE